ncbi:MAG: NYN domain-containing protein [Candidatus Sumerlaeia bacterium]|nr:NYN domain-containing protein [Candidatus Sumerlaeia bacterium]
MSDRRIAVLVDGSFFLKRLPKLVAPTRCDSTEGIVRCLRQLFRNHVKFLTGVADDDQRWHRHIYRNFYYDAVPYDGKAHHPIENRPLDFAKSDVARARHDLFRHLRKQPKLALRLGKVTKDGDWTINSSLTKKILRTRIHVDHLESLGSKAGSGELPRPATLLLPADAAEELRELRDFWKGVSSGAVALNLRQKGVDMRIGLDISTLTLKRQVDTIVLVAGDSDFVPAAKLARREGVQIVLDPLWQSINDDLFEHIDGLQSGFPRPSNSTGPDATEQSSPPVGQA